MIKIRLIAKQDFDQITQIEYDSFTDPYPKKLFLSLAEFSPDLFLVAISEEAGKTKILGYTIAEVEKARNQLHGHILSIAVSKFHRGQGIGSQLLLHLINLLKSKSCSRVFLEVRISNYSAKAFYKKHGFQEAELRRRYYEDGEDAAVMSLTLEEKL